MCESVVVGVSARRRNTKEAGKWWNLMALLALLKVLLQKLYLNFRRRCCTVRWLV